MIPLAMMIARQASEADKAAAVGFLGLSFGALICVGLISLPLYFIPTFVAWQRGHQNTAAIAILNLLGGWTIVGYIAALVWSFTTVEKRHKKYGGGGSNPFDD